MAEILSQAFHHFSFDYKQNVNIYFYFGAIAYAPAPLTFSSKSTLRIRQNHILQQHKRQQNMPF